VNHIQSCIGECAHILAVREDAEFMRLCQVLNTIRRRHEAIKLKILKAVHNARAPHAHDPLVAQLYRRHVCFALYPLLRGEPWLHQKNPTWAEVARKASEGLSQQFCGANVTYRTEKACHHVERLAQIELRHVYNLKTSIGTPFRGDIDEFGVDIDALQLVVTLHQLLGMFPSATSRVQDSLSGAAGVLIDEFPNIRRRASVIFARGVDRVVPDC